MSSVAILPPVVNVPSVQSQQNEPESPFRLSTFDGRVYRVYTGADWIDQALADQRERLGERADA